MALQSSSLKTRDLLRDSRCVLHSAVTSPDEAEGELKLYGDAVEADDQIRDSCRGWWFERPRATATVFVLHVEQASFVSWDIERGRTDSRHASASISVAEICGNAPLATPLHLVHRFVRRTQ